MGVAEQFPAVHKLAFCHLERVYVCTNMCARGYYEGGRWQRRQRERGVRVSGSVCPFVNAEQFR